MQKIRRRYPRARSDIRFQPSAAGLSLHDAHGIRADRLSFTAALVLTYCDGSHPPEVIAETVAALANSGVQAEAVRAEVRGLLQSFAEAGLVS